MKKVQLLLFVGLGLFLMSCSTTKTLTYNNSDVIKSIKKEFAPDSRVAVFKVKGVRKGKEIVFSGETTSERAKQMLVEKARTKFKNVNINVDNVELLPKVSLGGEVRGVVRLSACNIRSKPKHSSELSTQAILGTPINILKKENSWFYIQTPDGYLGWVDAAGIMPMNNIEQKNWFESDKVIYTEVFGFVYSKPDYNSNTISDIVEGSILKLMGESLDKQFWIVSFPDDRIGYINKKNALVLKDFLNLNSNYSANDIISSAKELMGIPYLWGGTSAKALDCSGFTKTVYFMHGILLPRDASQQVKVGKVIAIDRSFSKLNKGDLLFFGNKRKDGSDRITHVAIYLGNGKIIHETGAVRIQSLIKGDKDFSEHRLNTLMQVRRIIGVGEDQGVKKLIYVKNYWE